MEKKTVKDIVREELLGKFDYIIDNKNEYALNDVFRVRFLKNNIDEVVEVILAAKASYLVCNSDDYKDALKEYGYEFATLVKEKLIQEEYRKFGYDKGLPTLEEKKMMIRRHDYNIKYLISNGASDEYVDLQRLYNNEELELLECKRGELDNQFGSELIVKISSDVLNENSDNIRLAKSNYVKRRKKIK